MIFFSRIYVKLLVKCLSIFDYKKIIVSYEKFKKRGA